MNLQSIMYLLFLIMFVCVGATYLILKRYRQGDSSLKNGAIILSFIAVIMVVVSLSFGFSVHAKNVKYKNAVKKYEETKEKSFKYDEDVEDFDNDSSSAGKNTFDYCIEVMQQNNTGKYHNLSEYEQDLANGREGKW